MYADLHIHTYYSDGSLSPEEVVKEALSAGLSMISVCDHNTISAYDRLKKACIGTDIRLVQGVEIDVKWKDRILHLLAYHFNPDNKEMRKLLSKNYDELERISTELIAVMEADNQTVSSAEYEKYQKPLHLGGWKGLNYLLDKGMIENFDGWGDIISKYGTYSPQFCTLENACQVIQAAGGVSVLAHPGNDWSEIPDNFQEILLSLLECGINGIECYYPSHSNDMMQTCVEFCSRHHLMITCGGDGHGVFNQLVDGIYYGIGVMKIDMDLLNLHHFLEK